MLGQTKTESTNGNLNKSGGQMGLELEKGMSRVKLSWVEASWGSAERASSWQIKGGRVGAGRGAVVSHVWAWHANENAFIYKANDKSPKCQSKRCEETKSVSVSRSNRMYLYLSICKCIFIRIATWQAWSKMQNCTCCLLSNYLLAVHTHGYPFSCHMPHVTPHTLEMGIDREVLIYRKTYHIEY